MRIFYVSCDKASLPAAAIAVMLLLPCWQTAAAGNEPQSQLPVRSWQCPVTVFAPDDAGPEIQIDADQVERTAAGSYKFSGNVELQRGRQRIMSVQAIYDEMERRLTMPERFQLQQDDMLITGQSGTVTMIRATDDSGYAIESGTIEQVEYKIHGGRGHGAAELLSVAGDVLQLQQASYSACPDEGDDTLLWWFSSDSMVIDRSSGEAVAKGVVLRAFGVPVLYSPVLKFQFDGQRKSGLLPPRLRSSSHTGFDIAVPYYLNLAPDYDATIIPRLTANGGALLGGEFRYLDDSGGSGNFTGEYVVAGGDDSIRRGHIKVDIFRPLSSNLELTVQAERISDIRYFEDYGGNDTLLPVLQQQATLSLQTEHDFGMEIIADGWQSLRALTPQAKPYRRLPQISWYYSMDAVANVMLGMDGTATYFDRDNGITGSRVDLSPWLRLHWSGAGRGIHSTVTLRTTGYYLNHTGEADSSPRRVLPMINTSAFAHLSTWRQTEGSNMWHTLYGRLSYRYVPHRRQDHLPLFDTVPVSIGRSSLWYDNRYTGADRIGDDHSVTAGLEYNFRRLPGQLRGRYTLGQRVHFGNPRVRLDEEDRSSSLGHALLVQEFALIPADDIEVGADWLLNNENGRTERYNLRFTWQPPGDDDRASLWHSYRRDVASGINSGLELSLPLGDNGPWRWYAEGLFAWRGERDGLNLAEVGLEYKSCCWRAATGVRRYLRSDGRGHSLAWLLEIELPGLAALFY